MKNLTIILTTLIFFSCNSEKNLELEKISKQLSVVEINLIIDNQDLLNEFEACYQCNNKKADPRAIELHNICSEIYELTNEFINPKDSLNFYRNITSKQLQIKYETTVNNLFNIIKGHFDSMEFKKIKKSSTPPNFVELSNNKIIKEINVKYNQINILLLSKKLLHLTLTYMYGPPEVQPFSMVIDNNACNKDYSAYLLYAAIDTMYYKTEAELIKMTYNGNDINVVHSFTKVNGFFTFNFTPKKPGIYEWHVNYYLSRPNGYLKTVPFHKKVNIQTGTSF